MFFLHVYSHGIYLYDLQVPKNRIWLKILHNLKFENLWCCEYEVWTLQDKILFI